MTGKVAAGSKLPSETKLASHFNVSRPVIRQALDRLRNDRLISSLRGSGTYVREIQPTAEAQPSTPTLADLSHIQHGLELRLILEPECAALAAMRRSSSDVAKMKRMLDQYAQAAAQGDVAHHFDYGFHEAIAAATGNPRLLDAIKTLEYDVSHAINLWRHLSHQQPWLRNQDVGDEHMEILQLIISQDAEGARRAMRAHIEKARIRMLEGARPRSS